jgi:Mlc titration factor MtfA (ptsG expression regulator)
MTIGWIIRWGEALRRWHSHRRAASVPTDPGPWPWAVVFAHYPFLSQLGEDEKTRLAALGNAFLRDKQLTGAHDLVIDPVMAASIAAQACLPVLEHGLDAYRGWRGIVVYPGAFRTRVQTIDEDGVTHEHDDERIGEAWPGGPVVLSWSDARDNEPGRNVVIHEFAHKLAMCSGDDDGLPAPPAGMSREDWIVTIGRAQARLASAGHRGRPLPFDAYALTSEAEFFAVMSEAFFTRTGVLARHLPDLHAALARFYRQDALARERRASTAARQP